MDNNTQWHDPLLLTDVSSNYVSSTNPTAKMVISEGSGELNQSLEIISPQRFCDLFKGDKETTNGKMMLGFSLTSPDLVVCAGSPDIRKDDILEFPEKEKAASIVLSLEEGINGVEVPSSRDMCDSSNFSSFWRSSKERVGLDEEASLEIGQQGMEEGEVLKKLVPLISINVGCEDKEVVIGGTQFVEDNCFSGGDVIQTVAVVGGNESCSLYQTARFGEFSYNFGFLEPGKYVVDLHFAEIVLTDGPKGMRVFDVFIQDEKAVSGLDIFDRVGANRPLVIGDLEAFVKNDEGLSIRLKGVIGNPVLSGISVRKDLSASKSCGKPAEMTPMIDGESSKVTGNSQEFQRDYELQKQELLEAKKAIEELKKENQEKSTECQEAWRSLRELQNELMRKSMHVGSLAFAIEGQVKEKSKWFSCLNDLKRRLKILKLEHVKLSEEALKYKSCLGDMNDMKSAIQAKLTQQIAFHDDLKMKVTEGEKERKELYNRVLELKGNIRVFCRCRPLNEDEVSMGVRMAIDFASARDGEITIKSNGFAKKTFKFDSVFTPVADQADVFEDTAPFATSVLDGYNVCIFAYGQTGTGKTFTMEGTENARGVNYRTLAELFRIIDERKKLFKYEICVSVVEVYNEQIRDLLASGTQPGVASKRLEIRQVSDGVHYVPGLIEAHVNNMNEVWDVLQTGSSARAVGSTNANEYSSRSHCIHCVMVKGENLLNGECTKSKLWLVDLAGSERIAKTEVQGERLKEAQNINRSLSALGDVISALANKSPHVPFRNSKLTHLLQDSLGGDSKALMFVQISPNENDLTETLCSLNFASRVKGIELGPARKQLDNAEFLRYKQLVEKTKQETKMKDVHIKKMEETMHNMEMKIKEKDQKNKNLQEKMKELEAQLLVERKLARQHVDTKLAEQKQQNMKQLQLEDQNIAPLRPPLAAKPLGSLKATTDLANNVLKSPGFYSEHDYIEKENNPDILVELPLQPKTTGRTSLCPAIQKIPMTSTPRRNSLIPLPSAPMITPLHPLVPPLPPILGDCNEDVDEAEAKCLPESTNWSPKVVKNGAKKLNSVLRRSVQKKVKSPFQQQLRKGGVTVGVEKVRVSIGTRGRTGHRFLIGNGRRFGVKEGQQKRSQREKERGWNF